MTAKSFFIGLAAVLVAASAGWFTWRTQFYRPAFNVPLHTGLGQALAEQTAQALNGTGRVVLITLNGRDHPELARQMEAFQQVLARHPGLAIKETYELETEGKAKYRFGDGLSARRYVRLVNKNQSATAFVSFVGAPDLSEKDLAALGRVPPLIAECRSTSKLKTLFQRRGIVAALVSRFEYPTPIKGTPRQPREWVLQRYQMVTAAEAGNLPEDGD